MVYKLSGIIWNYDGTMALLDDYNFESIRNFVACKKCQYYEKEKCSNTTGCFWLDLEKKLDKLERYEKLNISEEQAQYLYNNMKDIEIAGKKVKAFDIIKKLLKEDCIISDLLPILNRYDNWEDYDCACDYYDENPILESKEEFDLLREVLR